MARVRDIFGSGNDLQIPINAQSVAPAGSLTADIDCTGYGRLLVSAQLFATTTPGDLTYTARAIDADGVTAFGQELPVFNSQANAAVGADVLGSKTYDVRGLQKVRITVSNANVAAKNATVRTYAGTA